MSSRMLTVLGAGGWVGAALVAQLRRQGQPVQAVGRAELEDWLAADAPAAVIYAIGLTADFRQRPHATVEAHVSLLSRVLQRPGVESLVYLSSTRVYGRSSSGCEDDLLPCLSADPSDLYNLSKLLGEALVLQVPSPHFRVVRLSNVVGPEQPATTFLGQLLREAELDGQVRILQSASTAKDYVSLEDVVRLLPLIASHGQQRLYNLASGSNTSHCQIAALLQQRGVGVAFNEALGLIDAVADRAQAVSGGSASPVLSVARLQAEFRPPMAGLEACRALILGSATPGSGDGAAV